MAAGRNSSLGSGPCFRAPRRCIVVQRKARYLRLAGKRQKGAKSKGEAQPRASVTFPPELYRTLEDLAKRKKVSLAWVVREAAEKYVEEQWPLFARPEHG